MKLCQLIQIYFKNNPVKFRPYLIWNNGALGFFWRGCPKKKDKNNKMSSDMAPVSSWSKSLTIEIIVND